MGRRVQGLHGNRRYKTSYYDTGKANDQREYPRRTMSRCQIAVTDGETSHEGEIQSVADSPFFYVPDQKPETDHYHKNPGQEGPDYHKVVKERPEENAPHLPPPRFHERVLGTLGFSKINTEA
jgi:hypothetical protein